MRRGFDLDSFLSSSVVLWAIAIISSLMMWVYVTGLDESSYITRKFSCELEYRGIDPQAILRKRISEIDIEVRGPEHEIMNLNYDLVHAYIDARNLLPGKRYEVSIHVELPSNIDLVSFTPSQAVLDLARQVTRLMNVETILPQNIPDGHYIEGVEIIPKEVAIRGAEDDIAKVGSVRVTPTVEELQKGNELLMPVKFSQSEPFDGNVTIEPAQVRFRGNLASGQPRKRVPVNARLTGYLDKDFEIRAVVLDPSEVLIEGPSSELAKVDAVDTEVMDISLLANDQTIVAPLREPEISGVHLASNSGVRVSLSLGEVRAEKMFANIPVEIRSGDRKYSCNPSNVAVTLEGRPSLIAKITPEALKLRAYVDVSNVFMSPITLPVKAEFLSDDARFRISLIEPSNVTVNEVE
ncbi:MAG: hypothetical protein IJS99_07130 [Synergistaceae bacterium]|nr:hypothetical protein [Synergistaceae bacterium]